MIKIFYCHQGVCYNQCKVVVSHHTHCTIPTTCLYDRFTPIWTEKNYVEGLEDII